MEVSGSSPNSPEQGILATLAEPNRFRIVEFLRNGPQSVGRIAETLQLRQPQTSKHLKVLLDAGLVGVAADGNHRRYFLRPEPFRSLDDWLESFRESLQQRYDRLDNYLQQIQQGEKEK